MSDRADPAGTDDESFLQDDTLNSVDAARHASDDIRRMIQRYDQQLSIARALSDQRGESRALLGLGGAYNLLGNERHAIGLLEHALVIARTLGDQASEGLALVRLGDAHNQLGDARGALRIYAQSLIILRALNDQRNEGLVLSYLGDVYISLGDTQLAWECYTQCRTLFGTLGDRWREAAVSWSMGELLAGRREYARAAELMQVLVDHERQAGDVDAEHHAMVLAQVRARAAQR
jgi:tetratricopeptide (TPR) repeat protein